MPRVGRIAHNDHHRDLVLDLSSGIALDGRVNGLKNGEQGAVIMLEGEVAVPGYSTDMLQGLAPLTVTQVPLTPDGMFRFEGIEPGTYTLLARAMSGRPRNDQEALANTRMATTVIEISNEGPKTIELTLR
jgi:hypothetical protein